MKTYCLGLILLFLGIIVTGQTTLNTADNYRKTNIDLADHSNLSKELVTVSGYITDENGEELIGVNVYAENMRNGTVTNVYGFYSLSLPKGVYIIYYSYIGYNTIERKFDLTSADQKVNINLIPATQNIEEVQITSRKKDINIREVKMSSSKLEIKTIKAIPALTGESDIIKSIQLLPGVQTVGEGTSAFFVRGGSVDQNLILLDEAIVYNPSHIGGFLSVFNSDAIKNVELYKGAIPSRYGGRLSSVLDVRMKEGNTQNISGDGGIGAISSRLTLEGPIVKDKSSFIISGRRTYIDLFFPLFNSPELKETKAYFYDLNGKINFKINDNNRVFISAYTGRDVTKFDNLFAMDYGNLTTTLRWNHLFNSRLFSNFTLLYSKFNYQLGVPEGSFSFTWFADIIDYSFKNDYSFYLNPGNTIRFGYISTFHTFKPGGFEAGEGSNFNAPGLPSNYALENAVFAENELKIGERTSLEYGFRFSYFANAGGTFYNYNQDYEVVDSSVYDKYHLLKPYTGIEPRIGVRYLIDKYSSIKVGYNRNFQYIHLATNTTNSTPLDVWFASNPNIKPQYSDQFAIGFFRNFLDNKIETSIEAYYKKMYHAIDFKDHSYLMANPKLDGEMRNGSAYSYGIEFLVRKQEGKFTGWISYTLSKTRRKIEGINEGKEYPSPYDKPHDLKIVGSYDMNERFIVSLNWLYSSPMPMTIVTEWYKIENLWVPEFSERNSIRIKGTGYHRLDLSVQYNIKKKIFNVVDYNLTLSVYNLYNRHNLYSLIYKQPENGEGLPKIQKMYLFGILPTFTMNFNF